MTDQKKRDLSPLKLELRERLYAAYQTYQNFSLMELKREFEKSVQHILQWIDAMNEEEIWHLNQRHWTGNKWPIGKWIQVNTIAPYTSARRKIRVWKKSKFG